jgi:hypothetical protein
MELVAKGALDEEVIDIENKTPLFNYEHKKKNKYTKGEYIFYPEGRANWGNTVRFYIERQGDLLYGLYLIIKLPKLSVENLDISPKPNPYDPEGQYRVKYSDYIGNVLIEKVSLYFNGQLIDEHYGDYMQSYIDLYISDWNRKAMLGMDDNINQPNLKIDSENIYIPFKFWFCHNNDDPLPLIAMANTEIYIDVKFRNFSECITVLEYNSTKSNLVHSEIKHIEVPIEEALLQANFYYLDLDERREMAMREYNILITQSQLKNTHFSTSTVLEIDFNHVVKDLIFLIQPSKHKKYGEYFNYSAKMDYPPPELNNPDTKFKLYDLEPQRHLLSRARILFNGNERLQWRDHKYFHFMQNHENYRNSLESYIYMYSFNINPTKDISFSGCNFSRLDNAQLQIEIKPNPFILNETTTPILKYPSDTDYELKCFATNFNILVIKGGLAGLKYNN